MTLEKLPAPPWPGPSLKWTCSDCGAVYIDYEVERPRLMADTLKHACRHIADNTQNPSKAAVDKSVEGRG